MSVVVTFGKATQSDRLPMRRKIVNELIRDFSPFIIVSMYNVSKIGLAALIVLLVLPALIPPASAATATGYFEVYCDGVGIFLTTIDGAPAPRGLVLFSRVNFPPGTIGDRYFGQGKWSDIYVLPNGCVPDGKCDSIADGRVWIDAPDTQDNPPKDISGKYKINFKGKLLDGTFLARKRTRKRPLRLCM